MVLLKEAFKEHIFVLGIFSFLDPVYIIYYVIHTIYIYDDDDDDKERLGAAA